MLRQNTGNAFLDIGEVSLAEGGGYPHWSAQEVAWLAEEWAEAQPVWERVCRLLTWREGTEEGEGGEGGGGASGAAGGLWATGARARGRGGGWMNGAELEGLPRLRLDFYETAVFLTRWQEDGRSATYPVSIHDVVSACTNVTLGSGLLPPETLFWGRQGSETRLGIYVPARRWRVQVEGAAIAWRRFASRCRRCCLSARGRVIPSSPSGGGRAMSESGCTLRPVPTSTTRGPSVAAMSPSRSAVRPRFRRRCACFWKGAPSMGIRAMASAAASRTTCASCGRRWRARSAFR
jgi:hypothetical protein